jgi:gluconate 2-dehydrogenase gamma chain
MRRRHFLTLSATSLGGVLVYTLARKPIRVHAQDGQQTTLKLPLRFFTEAQALTVAAAAAQIFPSDDSGPGANEAGVVIYIDRQLDGPYGQDRFRYTSPPFAPGVPEQGYQGSESPAQLYREGLKEIRGLHLLSPSEQQATLTRIEHTPFFSLLRTHTIEGMFCDPMHGGNAGLIGWQLIGFPGPRMSYAGEIDKYYGREFRPEPLSLAQVLGRNVKPGEEAK